MNISIHTDKKGKKMKLPQIIAIIALLSILGIVGRQFSATAPQHVSYSTLATEINGTTYTFLGIFSEEFSVIVFTNERMIEGELNSETQIASVFIEGKAIPLDKNKVYFLSEDNEVVPVLDYETAGVKYDFTSKDSFFKNLISIIEKRHIPGTR